MTTKKLWRSFQHLSRQPLYWLMAALRRRQAVSVDTLKQAPPRSILLIRLDGLGDVVLSLGTITAFHALYPQAEISVLVYKHSDPLLEHLPGVKRVFVLEKEHGDIFFDVMIPAPEAHTFKKQETLVRALGYDGPFDLPSLPLTEDETKIAS